MDYLNFRNFTCPACDNENAYFNGQFYECPDCDEEWGIRSHLRQNAYQDNNDSESFSDKLELIEEGRVGDKVDRNALIKLYSPSWYFEKMNMYPSEEGDYEDYIDDLMSELIRTKSFDAITKIIPPKSLSESEVSYAKQLVVTNYLGSRDELPLYPTTEDWANYINAPKDFIESILPTDISGLIQYLPDTTMGGFNALFSNRLKALYLLLKEMDIPMDDRISFKDFKLLFYEIIDDYGYNDDYYYVYNDEIEKYFSKELLAVRNYKRALNNWKQGSLDFLLSDAKATRITNLDAVILILEHYFKEVMD
ncbi:hypothetical protein K3G39_20195 [Pontibacter sp. HSC-14F20]|uniref:hypothetical protein n=1 Tax=Pontibacter sp. HSC-14F20 TaxID=2864136 RepID=UPI001C732308|nr:hypothetical protein [Pontibacter sp. HSC-14F20]MBX0335559.1 hypothetical protein [Pontibacter sp. HSC-14F20]